ncbi:hypothetical protein [Peribacillus sp. NPDC097295]|uniref:hypothetical protein n=1 Tax=Peribacillus sp. NPDC097295 TaxID=3364402 RepID=UPI00382FE5C9
MRRFFFIFLSFILLFSFILPSFAQATIPVEKSKEQVDSEETQLDWIDIEEAKNWLIEEEAPELFQHLEEINWDELEVDFIEEEVDWNSIPIEINEEISTSEIQPLFWGIVARLVLSGGKHVIKWGSKIFKKAPTSKVTNALAKFTTGTFKTGSHTFKLTKTDMKHMLTRHHPKYWDGTVKASQTFYNPNLSVNDVKKIALTIAKQNSSTLSKKGTNATFQVEGTVNGIKYVMGITKGHIKQLYPK